MRKYLLSILVLSPVIAQAGIANQFGFHCSDNQNKIEVFVGPAGPDDSGYPSDLSTPRSLEIKKGSRLDSTSTVLCEFDQKQVACEGETLALEVDLTTLRQHSGILDFFGRLAGGPTQSVADANASLVVSGWFGSKTVESSMICVFN